MRGNEWNILRYFYFKHCTIRQDSKDILLDGTGTTVSRTYLFNGIINNIKKLTIILILIQLT